MIVSDKNVVDMFFIRKIIYINFICKEFVFFNVSDKKKKKYVKVVGIYLIYLICFVMFVFIFVCS